MRTKPDESLVSLQHKDVTVRSLNENERRELLSLKNKNNPHLRGWMVERSAADPIRLSYGVFYRDNLVGEVSLRDFSSLSCQIAYWLDEPYWGLGITTKAVRLVTKHAFASLHVLEVQAYVHISNEASIKVLKKLGYEQIDMVSKKLFYEPKSAPHLLFACDSILIA